MCNPGAVSCVILFLDQLVPGMICKNLQYLDIAHMETDLEIVLHQAHQTTKIPTPFQQVSPL